MHVSSLAYISSPYVTQTMYFGHVQDFSIRVELCPSLLIAPQSYHWMPERLWRVTRGVKKKKQKAQKSTDKGGTDGGKVWKDRDKLRVEGERERWSRNSRPWPCALYWLGSTLFCLFLLYFYCAVWLWSLMNDSICKLHFIKQKSFRMSAGSGGRVGVVRDMMWSVQKGR